MRILVTGGAGFIGSHLCERLLREGHAVAILDDLNDFYAPSQKRAHLDVIRQAGLVRFFESDICDARLAEDVFAAVRPEAVVHLAARAGVRPSLADPVLYERVNVGGALVMLEAARRHGTRRFVLASSSSVYGAASAAPFREDDYNLLPISPYAATKLSAEKHAYAYAHLYGLSTVCLRFFTVYGPRQRPDLAIRKFSEAMLAGRPIPFFGDGSSARDYTFVADTVAGIVAALRFDLSAYRVPYEIFNLGNSSPIALSALVAQLELALGVKAQLKRLPDQQGDVPITYADISKARRLLGYRPATPLAEGLAVMAGWLRERESLAPAV